MELLTTEKLMTIFISCLVSIFIATFLLDQLKLLAKEMCTSIANTFKQKAELPDDVSPYRIIRVLYPMGILMVTFYIHRLVFPITSIQDFVLCSIISAILIAAVPFMGYVLLRLLIELFLGFCDSLYYLFWVPRKIYNGIMDSHTHQFFMFWGWLLFLGFYLFLVYAYASILL